MKVKWLALFLCLFLTTIHPTPVASQGNITFWTTEVEKDRLEVQAKIANAFRQKTGISVKVVPVEENMLTERVTAAYAAKSLPDVIFHPIDYTVGWSEAGILDVKAASEVIKALGPKTFGVGPLSQVKVKGGWAAVPVEGWGQLLLYRQDLFNDKGLKRPDTWDNILKAAKALHNPPLLWGFDLATDPGQTYTQQVFEHIALSNNVKLTGPDGELRLDTDRMIQTLEFYKNLARYSPPGNLYWLHTRLDYLTGRCAMMIWSPFILDELSGLRQDQPVLPDIAKNQPGFLAKNTGFVSIIHGPHGSAQYGQMSFFGITRDANPNAAKKWVEYLLSDGYLQWLSMAPEGKLPVRKGTSDSPQKFVQGWMELEFGATSRAKIAKFYGQDTVNTIVSGVDGFDRWGFSEGKGALTAKIYGTKIVPEVLKKYLDGEIDAKQAARMMDQRIKALE